MSIPGATGAIGSAIPSQLRAASEADAVIDTEEAGRALGPTAGMLALSADISNERAQRLLGWQPREVGLLEDLTTGCYRTA